MDYRNCVIARLVIFIAGLLLSVITAALSSLGVVTLLPAVFPFAAALGALLLLAIVIPIVVIRPYSCVRCCVLCIGVPALLAALALVVVSLIAIAAGLVFTGVGGTVLAFLLALPFWLGLLGFAQFARCLAHREEA